jgi:hypothetical protein
LDTGVVVADVVAVAVEGEAEEVGATGSARVTGDNNGTTCAGKSTGGSASST